ncbi:MAG TPA: ImmA/IrrE family metallo-endopeptidase [Candidatus Micrarchaeia archaeon]|nr:ImmA/IrrE family metallo-endopeptidase [Candidatus Micrarchaeia archaeon]
MPQIDVEEDALRLLGRFNVKSEPVPVDEIAKGLGARLAYERFDENMSGILVRFKDGNVIGINSSQAAVRQRFSIAHEIGHLQLHQGRPMHVDHLVHVNLRRTQPPGYDPEERDANQYAASLLMPIPFVSAALGRLRRAELTAESLPGELAPRFGVSRQAMEYRLTNLGLVQPG